MIGWYWNSICLFSKYFEIEIKKIMLNNNFFLNKKVVITGSTGFKGSWLSIWLDLLGEKYME